MTDLTFAYLLIFNSIGCFALGAYIVSKSTGGKLFEVKPIGKVIAKTVRQKQQILSDRVKHKGEGNVERGDWNA